MSYRAYLALVAAVFGTFGAAAPAYSADGRSPNDELLFHVCCSVEAVQQDLTAGADVNAKRENGKTALMNAGNANVARVLLEHGANVNAKDKDGKTALMIAAHHILGKTEVLQVLLEHGADVNAKDNGGRTALIWATYGVQHSPDVVRVLLEHGADVNAKDNDGKTALQYARMFFHEDVARLIIAHGVANPGNQLLEDANLGSIDAVRLDLSHGADVNAKDKDGKTALMRSSNNVAVSRLLVEHGANVNAKDNAGRTALMLAVQNKNTDVANLLLEHKADATPKDRYGRTAFEYAELSGGGKLTELIARHLPRQPAPARSGEASRDDLLVEEFLAGIGSSDWTAFFTFRGNSYYYSPSSVAHQGRMAYVRWYGSNAERAIYRTAFDCAAHTMQNVSVELHDQQTGASQQTQDLRPYSRPEPIPASYKMGAHLAQIACRSR